MRYGPHVAKKNLKNMTDSSKITISGSKITISGSKNRSSAFNRLSLLILFSRLKIRFLRVQRIVLYMIAIMRMLIRAMGIFYAKLDPQIPNILIDSKSYSKATMNSELYGQFHYNKPSTKYISFLQANLDKVIWDRISQNPAAIELLKANPDKIY